MNITFLVGNGFDIAAGANTSYRGFYEWYCEQPDERLHIQKFKEAIRQDIANGGENWSDFELGLGQYTDQFTSENISEFWDCYDDAQEKMVQYLKQEEDKLQLESFNETVIQNLRQGFLDFYKELSPKERNYFFDIRKKYIGGNTIFSFLSFNYTSILDAYLKQCSKSALSTRTIAHGVSVTNSINENIIHIHGTTDEYPTIGVNDISQIKNQELLSENLFQETMIKPENIPSNGYFWHQNAISQIQDSGIICIFGMSLGKTDLYWWQLIIKKLIEDSDCRLIIFSYAHNPLNKISSRKMKEATTKIKSEFISDMDLSEDDTKNVLERIHVVFNSKKVLNTHLSLDETEKVCSNVENTGVE